jgi:hypothetical protein
MTATGTKQPTNSKSLSGDIYQERTFARDARAAGFGQQQPFACGNSHRICRSFGVGNAPKAAGGLCSAASSEWEERSLEAVASIRQNCALKRHSHAN